MTSVVGHGATRPRDLSNLTSRTRTATRLVGAVLVALALVTATAACSGGGGGDEIDPVGAGRGGNDPTTDDVDAVEDVLADLLERHDEVVAEVLTDPSVAQDEDSELIGHYRELYSPDSEFPDQAIEQWAADAEAGTSIHAAESGEPAIASRLDGQVEVVSDDEVRFPLCQELRYASYDADGNLVEMMPYRAQPGEGTAVRVEGDWLLVQLTMFQGEAECRAAEETEEP